MDTKLRGALLALLLVALARPLAAHAAPIDEVPSGTMLTKDNWQIAQGMLPDEILEFYKKGEYANPILKLDAVNRSVVDPNMVAAAEKNRGRFDVDDAGTVIEKATGKRPPVKWNEGQSPSEEVKRNELILPAGPRP